MENYKPITDESVCNIARFFSAQYAADFEERNRSEEKITPRQYVREITDHLQTTTAPACVIFAIITALKYRLKGVELTDELIHQGIHYFETNLASLAAESMANGE